MISPGHLYGNPNWLAQFYRQFRVQERLLLTGHSHQAWPDCGFEGQKQAWLDAAEFLDNKWDRAFQKAGEVRAGFSKLMDDVDGEIALGPNTHALVTLFLSALPLRDRPRIVTTDGEFHSLRRQLDRLAEEGIEVVKVQSAPASSVCERLIEALDTKTAAVMASSVFFGTGEIACGFEQVLDACREAGSRLLIDAYHSLNVVPFSIKQDQLKDAFIVGGGYKYCELGEGNCFLRFPKGCRLRPVITGWFSEFDRLEKEPSGGVFYGPGAERFAGSTYDPTSHYRAAAVFDFFGKMEITPKLLREVSQHQIRLLADGFDALDLDPNAIARDRSIPIERIGGFLVLHTPDAKGICGALRERGVYTDFRGDALRLGPAPYLSDRQLLDALGILAETVR